MSKKNRRKIAQQNGAKAAGTKSPAGIQKSAANSTKHSLLCKTLVLANESQTRFDALYQAYIDRFQPADEVEMGFVNEMVAARWRQQRIWMFQTAGMNLEMDRQQQPIEETMLHCTEQTRVSLAFDGLAKLEKTLDLQLRYETSYSRMHDRAMKALQRLREASPTTVQPQTESEQIEAAEPASDPTVNPAVAVACEPGETPKSNLRNDAEPLSFPSAHPPCPVSGERSENNSSESITVSGIEGCTLCDE
jgi:hypothetical protein